MISQLKVNRQFQINQYYLFNISWLAKLDKNFRLDFHKVSTKINYYFFNIILNTCILIIANALTLQKYLSCINYKKQCINL